MDFPNYRKTPLFLALVFGLSLGVAGCNEEAGTGAGSAQNAGTAEQGEVVATVNGEAITQAELDEYRSNRPSSAQFADQEALLDELITREVVYQDALRKNLDEDPQVQKELEQMRTRALVSAAVRQVAEESPVSEEEMKAEYDKLKERMVTTEYKARHILVKEEAEARKVIGLLDKGGDFAELAREHSTGPTNKRGGDLGWFNPRQMVPEFSQALETLEKGSYTKEPVKTQFGWHVIKLEDTRQTEPPSFEQVKPQLEQMLQQKKVGEYIQNLKKTAEISIEKDSSADAGENGGAPAGEAPAESGEAPAGESAGDAAEQTPAESSEAPAEAPAGDAAQPEAAGAN